MLSFSSLEEVTSRLTDDIINPSMTRPSAGMEDDEVTHWHSTPLAFAILPAAAGLLFKNGSAFITDILLIVLAAIFMNWSIRLPWDWYYSAQAQRRDLEPDDISLEDLEVHETAVESASSSAVNSPKQSAQGTPTPEATITLGNEKREAAASELRRQEKLALFSTFVFPVLAAYLLHMIRAQLSSSSTGLVSDYNLSIFLLAAEVRPARQLVRLATNRTLHLQRIVTGLDDPFSSTVEEKGPINDLNSRLANVETKLIEHTTAQPKGTMAEKTDLSELSLELKKRYEPRVEALERAVRRYEKRSTTIAMATEQRLNSLETRLQDALSLAAVAAQQSRDRGAMIKLLDNLTGLITWPLTLAWSLAMRPFRMIEELYAKMKVLLLGPAMSQVDKRTSSRHANAREEKFREKTAMKKAVK